MRYTLIISLFLLTCSVVFPQQRILVAPDEEVIPLSPGESSAEIALSRILQSSEPCPTGFGFPDPPPCWIGWSLGARHRDVLGQWYVAPATGSIDRIYWYTGGSVGAQDSLLFIRVHKSYIGPSFGPGIRPGPYDPPCQMWGYWRNTNDHDMGIAPFIAEATDTTWVSTIYDSPVPSAPPFGEELWIPGGFPIVAKPGSLQEIDVNDIFPLQVTKGDVFFISVSVGYDPDLDSSNPHYPDEEYTYLTGKTFCTGTASPDYPSRVWKFYEHDSGTAYCNGMSIDSIKRGWMARGNFSNADSLTVGLYNIWYDMTVTSNSPPDIKVYVPGPVLAGLSPRISADIKDCHGFQWPNDGIDYALIEYSIDDVQQPDVSMAPVYSDTWGGFLPALSGEHIIRFRIKAVDLDGEVSYSDYSDFRIIGFGNTWYAVDTSSECIQNDISLTGTAIPPSSFFNPPYPGAGQFPKDDGTAGPFDIGGNIVLFGETFRYAWIGVNGAIALTTTANDTADVNSNGYSNDDWSFPFVNFHHGRGDTADASGMPQMFIAPFWGDFILEQDSPYVSFGNIYYGNDGNPCEFIVEWNSLGFQYWNGDQNSNSTFRVILNRCNGSVEFQYDANWDLDLWRYGLIGMQYDESPTNPYVFLNKNGYPSEIRPKSNWCYKMTPTAGATVDAGWNLVSVAGIPANGNFSKTYIFPDAISPAYGINGKVDTLANGQGYWMKFDNLYRQGVPGIWQSSVVISVQDKWNMIGSVCGPVQTGSIIAGGGTTISSPLYGYSSGYYPANAVEPGHGYYVKMSGAGTLTLQSTAAVPKTASVTSELGLDDLNTITITDKLGHSQTLYFGTAPSLKRDISYFELPPPPPAGAFDARFGTSGSMVETNPEIITEPVELPVRVQSGAYPLSVTWSMQGPESKRFEIITGGKSVIMSGAATTTIAEAKAGGFVVRVSEGAIPKKFALSQNYPNPFNPVTRFRVDVAATSPVEIAVFDILGRKIATLLNEEKPAGTYTLEWNGADVHGRTVPTGMYFIRMTAGEFTGSKKIVLLK